MYCQKCGQQLEDGAQFCTKCGAAVQNMPQQPQTPPSAFGYQAYGQSGAPVRPKSRKGLIIGLSAGGAALAVFLILLFIVILPGGGKSELVGTWYEQTGYGGSIEFKADGTYDYNAMGFPISGKYTFNSTSKTGEMQIEMMGVSQNMSFKLDGNTLLMEGSVFTRDYVEQQDLSDMLGDLDMGSMFE